MADDNKNSTAASADPTASTGSSSDTRPRGVTNGINLPARFDVRGRNVSINTAHINRVFVNVRQSSLSIRTNDQVSFEGIGLRPYTHIVFATKSEGQPLIPPVQKSSESSDVQLIFEIPKINYDGLIEIEIISNSDSDYDKAINSPSFAYFNNEEEDEKNKSKTSKETEEERIRSENEKSHLISDLVNAPLGVIGAAFGGAKGTGSSAQTGNKKPATASAVTPVKQEANEDFDTQEESQVQTSSVVLTENEQQAAELVGEYIDKNPEVISDVRIRNEILGTLGSGQQGQVDLSQLSGEARQTLQTTVAQSVKSQTGQGAQRLQEAYGQLEQKIQVQGGGGGGSVTASTQVQAQGGGSGQVSGEVKAESKSAAEIKAKTSTEAKVSGQMQGQAQASFGGVAPSAATAEVSAQGTQPAKTSPVQRQNMEVVGEYLDKNPNKISSADSGTRNRIIQALASGNTDSLNKNDQEVLKKTLNALGQDSLAPAAVRLAADNLSEGEKQPSTEPVKTATGSQQENLAGGAGKPLDSAGPKNEAEEVGRPPKEALEILNRLKKEEKPLPPGVVAPPKRGASAISDRAGLGGPLKNGSDINGQTEGVSPAKNLPAVTEPRTGAGEGGEPTSNVNSTQLPKSTEQNPPTERPNEEAPEGGAPDSGMPPVNPKASPTAPVSDPTKTDEPESDSSTPALPAAAATGAANTALGNKIYKEVGEVASSQIWYFGFSSSCLTLFSGFDFMLGGIVMAAYWIFGHRKNKELFPLKRWQKAVTILAFILPIVYLVVTIELIIYVGCNSPVEYNAISKYKLTYIGSVYPDVCESMGAATNTGVGAGGGTPTLNPSAPPAAAPAVPPAALQPRGSSQ